MGSGRAGPKTAGARQFGHGYLEQSVQTLTPQPHILHDLPHSPSQRLQRRQRPHDERSERSAVGSPSDSSTSHGPTDSSQAGQALKSRVASG